MASPDSNSPMTYASVGAYGATYIDALLCGKKWDDGGGSGVSFTYSFLGGSSYYQDGYSGANEYLNAYTLSAAQKDAAASALQQWLSSTVGSEAWNSRDLKSRPH